MARPVLPDSFWTYIGFQLPSDQVNDLRVALSRPGQNYGGWYRQEWSVNSCLMTRGDIDDVVMIDGQSDFVKFADDDKCVVIDSRTGCIAAINRGKRTVYGGCINVRFILQRGMRRWCLRRKQRRDATTKALNELRLLIPDLYPLAIFYIGSV